LKAFTEMLLRVARRTEKREDNHLFPPRMDAPPPSAGSQSDSLAGGSPPMVATSKTPPQAPKHQSQSTDLAIIGRRLIQTSKLLGSYQQPGSDLGPSYEEVPIDRPIYPRFTRTCCQKHRADCDPRLVHLIKLECMTFLVI
jgi:hypothetical protein